jgi:two-component system LytT family response regulator
MENNAIIISHSRYSEVVHLKDIVLCEAAGSYTRICLEDAEVIILSKNLSWVEKKIADESFIRLHKSFIINLHFVSNVYTWEDKIGLTNGKKIPIARHKKKMFWARLKKVNNIN